MSQTKKREPKQFPKPVVWWPLLLGSAVALILFVTLILTLNWVRSFRSPYETTTAKILEIRRVVVGTLASKQGDRIIYGVEAHVQYLTDGRLQDRWLRASDDLPQESLDIKLASHPTDCLVYWPQNHPQNARCSLK